MSANSEAAARSTSRSASLFSNERIQKIFSHFLLEEWQRDPELARRGRFIVRAGFLGCVFGAGYAAFYLLIGHLWGAGIVLACSFGFALMPWIMRWTRRIGLAGHGLAAILTAGFGALCCVEGGLRGHAVAWLATVPLCALLLVGAKAARIWVLICFVVCAVMIAAEMAEIPVPITYGPEWHSLVNSAGQMGLIAFMFALGLIFEDGRRRAFGRMQDALDQLAASNREKTEFLGIAAHDLRNPLSIIIGYAQMLPHATSAAEAEKFSKLICTAGTRMRDLIKNLLDANAVEQGQFTPKQERCRLSELLAESLQHNRLEAERKGIALEVEGDLGLSARADKSGTVQVLDNLVSNAIKYSPLKMTVRLHASRETDRALVSVIDQGPGIDEDDRKKMFGKFARLTARPTGGESSTGLGLSIVKKLVETMSGSIECRSVLGEGSTFILRLPLWPDDDEKLRS